MSQIESRVPSTVVECVPVSPSREPAFEAVEEEKENVMVLLALLPLPSCAKLLRRALLVQPFVVHELNDRLLRTRVSEKLPCPLGYVLLVLVSISIICNEPRKIPELALPMVKFAVEFEAKYPVSPSELTLLR